MAFKFSYNSIQNVFRIIFLTSIIIFQNQYNVSAQNIDSTNNLEGITISAFGNNRIVNGGTIIKSINQNNADRNNKTSLVAGFNAIAGVKMEERSPGSYRINIRGSSLRSPFGVRNIKVYWNNIPITDPGGNTYFNQFAFNNFSTIEIIKGPAGSMYGAGTGGTLLMHSSNKNENTNASIEYITGSYGMQNVLTKATVGNLKNKIFITHAHNKSNGYRENSKNKKDNFSLHSLLNYSKKNELEISLLYNNLYYQTPGGLTLTEFKVNPKQARPAAGVFPSAQSAKASIYQQNITGGVTNYYKLNNKIKNTITIYATTTTITNPTFRNYEKRKEPSIGARTNFLFENKINNNTNLQIIAGAEWQQGKINSQVFTNIDGEAGNLQSNYDIKNCNFLVFTQGDFKLKGNWIITVGISNNNSNVQIIRLSSNPIVTQSRKYNNEVSPRIAVSKKISKVSNNILFTSISKGFSPPTTSELLPSTGVVSTFLQAEYGINYEAGGKFSFLKNKLQIDLTGFNFNLKNALVARKDSNNADYFVNAGSTQQKGLEINIDYRNVFFKSFLKKIKINSAITLNKFKYGNFVKGATNFLGKILPSVPKQTLSLLADIGFKKNIYFNTTLYLSSKLFLDDANKDYAEAYNLIGCRIGKIINTNLKLKMNIYTGFDNLLNTTYSLGNDINAAGGRYYNAAANRSFYIGIEMQFQNKKN